MNNFFKEIKNIYGMVALAGGLLLIVIISLISQLEKNHGGLAAARQSTCEFLVSERQKELGITDEVKKENVYVGKPAEVKFYGQYTQANEFRSKIREAVAAGVNFAGHYSVATWGCGAGCQNHAVVDVMTGDIVSFGLNTEMGARFSKTSKILITNPKESFPSSIGSNMSAVQTALTWSRLPREYYELTESDGEVYLQKLCVENPFEGKLP